jgi:hypothetical protein
LHVVGRAVVDGDLSVLGPMRVADQGDIGMGSYTNGAGEEGAWSANAGQVMLTSNVTYLITPDMAASNIQAVINGVPRNLNGYTATFNFTNGTWTLATQLTFSDFADGLLTIAGVNVMSGTNYTTQSTVLNIGTNNTYLMVVRRCRATVYIRDMKLRADSSANRRALLVDQGSGPVFVYENYFLGTSTANGSAVQFANGSFGYAYYNTFNKWARSVYCSTFSRMYVYANGTAGTTPLTGHQVDCGAILQRGCARAIGATDHLVGSGGLIVTSAGKILL